MKSLFNTLLVAACLMSSAAMGQQPARDQAKGPLRVHPTNPRYFTDGTKNADGSVRAVYLTGAHTWNALYDAGRPLDYRAYLNFLVRHNHNFMKFRAWDSTLLYGPMCYKRTGPGAASDGLLKVDLNQFDQAHFDRMRERLIAARDKGIYVLIMLFTTEETNGDPAFSNPNTTGSWEHTARSRWSFHPYNKLNNINGIDGGNRDNSAPAKTESLSHAEITALREAYIRKVVDTVNDLDNVLFEIANETHNGDPNATNVNPYATPKSPYGPLAPEDPKWQYHMIDFIHSYEKTKPKQHPVIMTASLFGKNDTFLASPAEGISPSANGGGRGYQDNPPVTDGKKVVLFDPDHFGWIAWRGTPSWVWKSFMRGLNPIPLDSLPTSIAGNDGGGWGGGDMAAMVETRKALGHTRSYATKMNLASMVPRNDLASTKYCLANPGQEYLVYQPGTGDFSVNLTAANYAFEWFNPSTGTVASTGSVKATEGNQTFTPPFSGSAVLYLRQSDESAGRSAVPARSLASKYPLDAGIAKDPAVLFADNFETGEMKKWDEKRGRVVLSEDRPNAGHWCVQMPMERGKNTGGDATKWFLPGADKVYARFYVRFSADYQYNHHFVTLLANQRNNKWSAFGKAGDKPDGTYYSSGMEPAFAWGRNSPPGEVNLYSYFLDMEPDRKLNKYWGNPFFPPGPGKGKAAGASRVIPPLDQWQCWEFMMQANSAPDKADGKQALWVDGKLAGEFTGIRWRSDMDLKVNCLWLQHYGYDGGDPTKEFWKESQSVWFDDVVVATEYIGPMKK